MANIDTSEYEHQALSGDWRAAVSVLSRSTVKPEVREALMIDDAHREVRIALARRQDVTAEELTWIAMCDDPFVLNIVVSHPQRRRQRSRASVSGLRAVKRRSGSSSSRS